MPRPAVFTTDTFLFHPVEGKKLFPAGETDPGPAWHDKPGGPSVGQNATAEAMKDLIAAQDQIDGLGQQLASKDHDLAQMAKERDEANAKLADAEQRARDAESARAEAEKVAAEVTGERDRLAALETELRTKIAGLEVEIAKVDGDKDGKVGGSAKKTSKPAGDEDGGL